MSVIWEVPYADTQINPLNTHVRFQPFTPWIPFTGLDKVSMVLNVEKVVNDVEVQAAWQAAEIRTDDPRSSLSAIGTAVTTTGRTYYEEDLTGAGQQKNEKNLWVRFGVRYASSGTTARGFAQVGLDIAFQRFGGIASRLQQTRLATFDDGGAGGFKQSQYEPIGGWHPAVSMSQVVAGVIITGLNSTSSLGYGLAYRVANDKAAPGAWTNLTTLAAPSGTNEEKFLAHAFTTELANQEWVQFALEYANSTGSDAGTFIAEAVLATRT